MVFIGDIEIPIVYSMEETDEATVDEVAPLPSKDKDLDNIAVQHEASVKEIAIQGYLNQEVHSESKTIDEQKREVKKLQDTDVTENSFEYIGFKGHLVIRNVDLTDNSDSKIVNEVLVEASYHPWPKYFPEIDI